MKYYACLQVYSWEQRKFGNLFSFLQNNTLSRSALDNENGRIQTVHYGDVLIKFGECLDVTKEILPFIREDSIAEKYKDSFLQNGDIIIADTAEDETVGKCTEIVNLSNQKIIAGLHTMPVRSNENFAAGYLGFYLNSDSFHNQLKPLMQGTKVTSISKRAIQDTVVKYPLALEEQQEIGKYFWNLDNLITLHQRKHDKLISFKKAMLEKMFPKENEKVPEIRFQGFTDDWEQRKLGEFGKATGGTSLESEFVEKGNYKVISIGSYSETSKYNDQGLRTNKTPKTESKILNKDDLTMILNDKTAAGTIIGRVLLIDADNSYVYNQRTERIEVYKEDFEPSFLYQLLNAENIRSKIIKASQGNTQIYVNWSSISELEYLIPKVKSEQKKIATILNNLDNLITLHQCKLEKLKNIKKSMLEKMFV